MSIVTMKNFSYKYPTSAEDVLHEVNLNIEEGKLYALIGENGGGKTTLCNVIRGFIPHFFNGELQGEATVLGKDIRDWQIEDLAERIGYVFQNPFTQISGATETVFEEIAFGLENLGIEVELIKEKVEEILVLLEIEYLRDKNPYELSGGQKQRVAFASVIVMDPDVLVLDEPTSQLDPQGTEEVFKIIELMKKQGKTIILVEHKIELIAEYADEVILVQNSKIIKSGKAEEVLADEDIVNYGGMIPQYALFGMEMKKKNMELPMIPLTKNQSISAVESWLEKKE